MNDAPYPMPSWARCLGSIEDVELRAALVRLIDRTNELINAYQGDRSVLVVLVSHRMTCLYDMFLGAGFPGFDGAEVISDRALDADAVDVAGRTTVLLDDAFILGSTLADLYDVLVDRDEPAVVTTMVACVDLERYNQALLAHVGIRLDEPEAPCLRSTKELESFAFELASCLYRAGVPYFSDFPVVRQLELDGPAFDALLVGCSDRWYVTDVTPLEAFAGPARRAYSLVPRSETAEVIRSRLAGRVGEIAELLKIRLYVSNDDVAHHVRIVPIGVPGAMMSERLKRELAAVEASLAGVERSPRWTEIAKHRLLQMYISIAVLTEFWADFGRYTHHELTGEILERSHLRLYFGDRDAPVLMSAFDAAIFAYRNAEPQVPRGRQPALVPRTGLGARFPVRRDLATNALLIKATRELRDTLEVLGDALPPDAPAAGDVRSIDRVWAHRALEVFGLVDRELERPQEMALRDYDYESYRRYRSTDGDAVLGPRVIKQGLAAAEIARLLLPELVMDDEWSRVVGSFAIDVGNDIGVVVPSTKCGGVDGPIFRQYRSGETAYMVNCQHSWLYRRSADEANQKLDLFTRYVIKEDLGGDPAPFLTDTSRIVEVGLGGREVIQVWDGSVYEVTDKHFCVDVQSRLSDDVGSAALELDLLGSADRQIIAPGARVEWVIVQDYDEVGRTHRAATVRITHSAVG